MATNFSPCKGSYVLNQFPSNVMFGMNGFHVSASGAIQGHHGPLVFSSFGSFGTDRQTQTCVNERILGTDEEKAFIKAIKNSFPNSKTTLCTCHLGGISKGISKQYRNVWKGNEYDI